MRTVSGGNQTIRALSSVNVGTNYLWSCQEKPTAQHLGVFWDPSEVVTPPARERKPADLRESGSKRSPHWVQAAQGKLLGSLLDSSLYSTTPDF